MCPRASRVSREFSDDGRSAFERAVESPPAVVVTEIVVPGVDGLALCRLLREHHTTRLVPVVVFSIHAASSRAAEAGASAFLNKPTVESVFIDPVRGVVAVHPAVNKRRWASR